MTTLQFQLTRDEIVRSVLRRRMLDPPRLAVQGLLVLLGIALFALPAPAPDVGLFLILFVLALNGISWLVVRRLVDKAGWLTSPVTLTYGADGIVLAGEHMRNEYAWGAFGRWTRTDKHFLVFPGRMDQAVHVPLRAFAPEQLAEFTALLQRIGPQAPR